ncbi:MAG: hypothetical protein HC859_03665 [Bacteroidia bacterium]|nr:hypothetical protein [Bacteroidia bacterium]
MLPNTSLIALENDAQRKALLQKQQDLLDGNANLDASDDIRNMSEPGFWWIAAMVLLLAMAKRKMPLGLSGIWMLLRNYSFSRKG